MSALLSAHGLHAARPTSDGGEETVNGFTGEFFAGRTYLLTGPSGGGKRLLWRLLAFLETPRRGSLFFEGVDALRLSADALADLRNRRVGYVFSTPYLLPGFSVVENVAMPLFKVLGVDPSEAKGLTETALQITELADAAQCTPDELSPLQRRLAAVARAVCCRPALLAVDDLGKDLSAREGERLAEACRAAVREYGLAMVATAAGADALTWADERLTLRDGRVRSAAKTPDAP